MISRAGSADFWIRNPKISPFSAWAPNLVSDTGGNPEKRPGWRSLFTVEGTVNGLFSGVVSLGEGAGEAARLLKIGLTTLYRKIEEYRI